MKKLLVVSCLSMLLMLMFSSVAMAAYIEFDPFWVRGAGSVTEISNGDVNFVTPAGGDKAGYGTHFFDGQGFGSILSVDFDKVDGGPNNPYLNIWVTDGTNYAIISSENDYRGTDLQSRTEWKVFEYDTVVSLDWLVPNATRDSQYLMTNGVRATLADLAVNAALSIADPGNPYPGYVGTGAPKGGYGFNIIYGDTLSNFVGGYHLNNLSINGELVAGAPVPEPATMFLFGLGILGLAGINRRKQ